MILNGSGFYTINVRNLIKVCIYSVATLYHNIKNEKLVCRLKKFLRRKENTFLNVFTNFGDFAIVNV